MSNLIAICTIKHLRYLLKTNKGNKVLTCTTTQMNLECAMYNERWKRTKNHILSDYTYMNSQKCKSMATKIDYWLSKTKWKQRENVNGLGTFFYSDRNVLKLDCSSSCTTVNVLKITGICTLKMGETYTIINPIWSLLKNKSLERHIEILNI